MPIELDNLTVENAKPREILTIFDERGGRILSHCAEQIPPLDLRVKIIAENLLRTFNADLESGSGIAGLAANELGYGYRVVLLLPNLPDIFDKKARAECEKFLVVNPRITWRSKPTFDFWCGCRSVPGYVARTTVPKQLILEGFTTDGKPFMHQFNDENAGVVEHEIRHLDGETIASSNTLMPREEYDAMI